MKLQEGFIEELQSAVLLSSIIDKKVKLTKRGQNFTGLCPFHSEKTPSFNVIDDKGYYHCFGCGAHGDAISFIRNTENLGFIEAIEKIANIAGIKVPNFNSLNGSTAKTKTSLLKLLNTAATYFSRELKSKSGQKAIEYLKSRGVGNNLIGEYFIGYAPINGIKHKLLDNGFFEKDLIEAGLIRKSEKTTKPIDIFRDRVIFTIFNERKEVIGFGGRSMFESKIKYINSPNSEIFQKSKILYGLPHAKEEKKTGKKLLIVEGYMDVISIRKTDFAVAVSSLGTALSEIQIKLIWKVNDKPIICFDGDKAGKAAAWRFIKRVIPILNIGKEVYFSWLPEGKDPDNMINNGEEEKFKNIINASIPLIDAIWKILLEKYDISNINSRAAMWVESKNVVQEIQDNTLRRAYLDEVYNKINLMRQNSKNASNHFFIKRPKTGISTLHNSILSILINHPTLGLDYSEQLLMLKIKDKSKNLFLSSLLDQLIINQTLDREDVYNHLKVLNLIHLIEELSDESLYRRIGFNPAHLSLEKIETKFRNLLEHALNSLRRT